MEENVDTGVENNVTVQEEVTATPATGSTSTNETQEVKAETVEVKAPVSINPVIGNAPLRSIPITTQAKDEGIEQVYKDAVHLDSVNLDVVFEEVDASGRGGGSRFIPNIDPNRVIKTFPPKKGDFVILPIGRNSDKVSEGGLIPSSPVEFGFGYRFFSAQHKTQVTLVLVNGKHLPGYVLKGEGKGSRRALYFPKHVAESVITLPRKGKQLKLQVAKFLVG